MTLQNIRYALRMLRKNPGLTATVIFTLALGIGATTAIFSLTHTVMLKSLPVKDPGSLYRVGPARARYELSAESLRHN